MSVGQKMALESLDVPSALKEAQQEDFKGKTKLLFKDPNERNILSKTYPHFSEESNRKVSPKSQYTIPQYTTHGDSYSERSFLDCGQDCGEQWWSHLEDWTEEWM